MSALELPALAAAAFVAGAINGVAGGGSLVSFPALLAAGFPAKHANVTNTVALWPGYLGGSIGYGKELGGQRRRALLLLLPSIVGAIAGAAILLLTPDSSFNAIVPFLVLFATLLLAVQGPLGQFVQRHRPPPDPVAGVPLELVASVVVLAMYGAYFGAGLGILTLAALGILLPDDLHRSNALKGLLSLIINAVAVISFALFGPVEWLPAGVMALAALAGGYLGVRLVRRLSPRWLRVGIVGYGLAVSLVLFVR